MPAPLAAEAVKAILYGIIAHLLAEWAYYAAEDGEPPFPMKPQQVPTETWREIQKAYKAMCDCNDDPEALEICRDRMISNLEATLPQRSTRRR